MSEEMNKWNIFVWKIENFSYCWHKANECITSPTFYMEGSYWNLELFPRGTQYHGYIALHLKSQSVISYEIEYSLSCLDPDGSSVNESHGFHSRTVSRVDSLANRSYVFVIKRETYLPNNTLTVCCKIARIHHSNLYKYSARTCVEVRSQTILGEIPTFIGPESPSLCSPPSTSVQSESLQKPIQKIILSRDGGAGCDQNIFIEIYFLENQQRKFSTCNVFLLDAVGTKLKCGKSENWFDSSETFQAWKFPLIFTEWELMAKKDFHLLKNTLYLQLEISSTIGISKEEVENVDSIDFSTNSRSLITNDSLTESSALEDLGSLIRDNILCDVNLQTSTKTFPAHKAILSARSPVFKAMYTNDLKEATTNQVYIDDLEDETVRRLLMYIYTNTVEDLQWQNASQLYVAAYKYAIGSLKKKCSSILDRNLCTSNVCEILALVDKHNDAHMKNCVHDYILKNDEEVIDSDEWYDLELKNPQLTSETMCQVYRKAKKF